MSRLTYSALAGSVMLTTAFPAFAGNIYCTVVGVKQGKFQSDASLRSASTGIAVYALTEDIKVPFDASSGQGSGRAQNSPVTIVKELDASSPQFFEAAVTNERLDLGGLHLLSDHGRRADACLLQDHPDERERRGSQRQR